MPTIPIFSLPESGPVAARRADPENPPYGRVELSPTALAFLIPLFIIFIFGPIACILCIRRTHRGRDMPPRQPLYAERLAGRREDARKKLINVTTHSNVADSGKFACKGVAGADGGEKMADSLSMLERECAICLSPLHAHSLPEPVKLGTGGAEVGEASMTRSVLGKSRAEEILKLRVCGHEFHAECLVSWFILWKYICPICRAVYYDKKNVKKGTANDQTESVGAGEGPSEEGGRRKEGV